MHSRSNVFPSANRSLRAFVPLAARSSHGLRATTDEFSTADLRERSGTSVRALVKLRDLGNFVDVDGQASFRSDAFHVAADNLR